MSLAAPDGPATKASAPRLAPELSAYLIILTGAACIGFSAVFVRYADVGPAAIGFWRMVFALPLLMTWQMRQVGGHRRGWAGGAGWRNWPAIAAGLAFATDVTLFNAALERTSIASASLLGNLSPIFVVLGAWLFFRQRPSLRLLGTLALAVAGAVLLVLPKIDGTGMVQSSRGLLGDGLAAAAALAYALYLLAVRRARDDIGAGEVALVSTLVCMVACLGAAFAMGETILPGSWQGWLAVIALGMVSHAMGQGLITISLGTMGASAASLVLVFPAVVSIAAAWVIFSETPTPVQLVGGVAILVAVALARRT
jgi:drug/metabolite transporter (DMT)-like permease